eukprot:augustus_masked-scaffold_58-processed-gene-0.6-mRNA-1 protein AED:0.04 eAED:0.07 QI:0/-1/0/1/-1/1/1/0/2254
MIRKGGNILEEAVTNQAGIYQPTNSKAKAIFEQLLQLLSRKYFKISPHSVLEQAVDEILHIVKDKNSTSKSQLKDIKFILSSEGTISFSDIDLGEIRSLVDQIVDFVPEEQPVSGIDISTALEDEAIDNAALLDEGVAIDFDSENDEEGVDIIRDTEGQPENILDEIQEMESEQSEDENVDRTVLVEEISSIWLQEKLQGIVSEKQDVVVLIDKVLKALGVETDREAEQKLLDLLPESKDMRLLELLLSNRESIYYLTSLYKEQDPKRQHVLLKTMMTKGLDAEIAAFKRNQEAEGKVEAFSEMEVDLEGFDLRKAKRKEINLLDLEIKDGEHHMSNEKVFLPKNSWQKKEKEFEEIHVPAPPPPEVSRDEKLVPIKKLPSFAHPAFKGMSQLNRIQSRIFPKAMDYIDSASNPVDNNLLICAPTGAGKTNVAMMTILNEIGKFFDETTGTVKKNKLKKELKIVYVAPMKALVQEIVVNYSNRLTEAYGMQVKELSGDVNLTRNEIENTQVIITTPEKFDVITRKPNSADIFEKIKLVIFDEIHILHNERGAVLETLICRIFNYEKLRSLRIRLLGLSATLPNYQDVATLLRVDKEHGYLFYFDGSFRPVPLNQVFIGITQRKALKQLQVLNKVCFEKVKENLTKENLKKNQLIVFVHSRNETYNTAKQLIETAVEEDSTDLFFDKEDVATNEILTSEIEQNPGMALKLKEVLAQGIGIHHAGLSRNDRNLVEDLFLNKKINVLVSTATIAWGVNLPANTVIIKGTSVYNVKAGGFTELSFLDILQMLGRAGRPQFDTVGTGIIITSHENLNYYLSLLTEQLPIESQLVRSLPNILNAEIVSGVITNIEQGLEWLRSTYLCIRMFQNPKLYGCFGNSTSEVEAMLLDLFHSTCLILNRSGLIRYDQSKGDVNFTPLGRIASYYYLSVESVNLYNRQLKPSMSDIEILRMFSLSTEFSNISIRSEEKQELAKLGERVPIPIKDSIDDKTFKINCLLQSYISNLSLSNYSVKADLVYIYLNAERIFRALFEISLSYGFASIAQKCLSFANMVSNKVWSSQSFLRQLFTEHAKFKEKFSFGKADENSRKLIELQQEFDIISLDLIRKLERSNLLFSDYRNLSEFQLGELVNRNLHTGKTLKKLINIYPKVNVTATAYPLNFNTIEVNIKLQPEFEFNEGFLGFNQIFWLMVVDNEGEEILYLEQFMMNKNLVEQLKTSNIIEGGGDKISKRVVVRIDHKLKPTHCFVRVQSDKYLSCISEVPVNLGKLVLPRKPIEFNKPPENPAKSLLELLPQSFNELILSTENINALIGFPLNQGLVENLMANLSKNLGPTSYQEFLNSIVTCYGRKSNVLHVNQKYYAPFWGSALTKVQTEVSKNILRHGANLCLSAPNGCGRTLLAEIAILKVFINKLRLFLKLLTGNTSDWTVHLQNLSKSTRAVFVAPNFNALKEVYKRWKIILPNILSKLGFTCNIVLIDPAEDETSFLYWEDPANNIIISDVISWDRYSRHYKTKKLVSKFDLIIFENLQLLGDEIVGPVYESALVRARFLSNRATEAITEAKNSLKEFLGVNNKPLGSDIFELISSVSPRRIIGLSDAIGNTEDIGAFIGAETSNVFKYGFDARSSDTEIFLQTFNDFEFESLMASMSAGLLATILNREELLSQKGNLKQQVIVFVPNFSQAQLRAIDLLNSLHLRNMSNFLVKHGVKVPEVFNSLNRNLLKSGTGILYKGMTVPDRQVLTQLFQAEQIGLIFVEACLSYEIPFSAALTIIMNTNDNQVIVGNEQKSSYNEFSLDLIQNMIGKSRISGSKCSCVLMTHSKNKNFYEKALEEPFTVESQLPASLSQVFNTEIVNGNIKTKQNCVDYLTWTYFYQRLVKNPNYYNLENLTSIRLSEFLSELVENESKKLSTLELLEVEDGGEEEIFTPLNLGYICFHYALSSRTADIFHNSISAKSKLPAILEVLCYAKEFDSLLANTYGPKERDTLEKFLLDSTATALKISQNSFAHAGAELKVNILLQSYLSRSPVNEVMSQEQRTLVIEALRLISPLVDIIASNLHLHQCLNAMELSQMFVQRVWKNESLLKQVPYLTVDLIKKLEEHNVKTVFDLIDMEDDLRLKLLNLNEAQLNMVAEFCNSYPDIEVEVSYDSEVKDGEKVYAVKVYLARVIDEEDEDTISEVPRAVSEFCPMTKLEQYWIILADEEQGIVLGMRKVKDLLVHKNVGFEVETNEIPKSGKLKVFVVCDSYLGVDQEHIIEFNLA